MNNKKIIVFDWDGTIVDSTQVIVNAYIETFKDMQISLPSIKTVKSIIGLTLVEGVKVMAPDVFDANASTQEIENTKVYQKFYQIYKEEYLSNHKYIKLFPQIQEGLNILKEKNFLMTIATGKSRAGLERDLSKFHLHDYFQFSITADESLSKPNPAMLYTTFEKMNCKASDCIMLGDSIHDLKMAKAANVTTYSVSYGAEKKEILEKESLQCFDSFITFVEYMIKNNIK